MDNAEIYKLITNQRQEIKSDLKEAIKGNNSILHAQMINEVDRIDHKVDKIIIHNEWQNGMLGEHDEAVKELGFFRIIGRNPKISAIVFLVIIMIGAWGYHTVNFKRTLKNMTKIELNESDQPISDPLHGN